MPQNTEGSASIFLLWIVWIYWRLWNGLHQFPPGETPDASSATPGAAPSGGASAGSTTFRASQQIGSVENRDVTSALLEIEHRDRSFSIKSFLANACAAYEKITTAFASGDRMMLESCLSREVYEDFVTAINERERRGERMETSLVRVSPPEVVSVRLDGDEAEVSVRFVSELFSVTRSATGVVVRGDPRECTETVDVWTFAKRPSSRDPAWKLVASNAV